MRTHSPNPHAKMVQRNSRKMRTHSPNPHAKMVQRNSRTRLRQLPPTNYRNLESGVAVRR
ncbi:hypothetical protein, partial [Rhodococcus sp. Leaf258]|uniref:hypothetical protein n=1 Tax=Rhodococcus sp. Leaf258 TaxID=1736310 RepID=UPI000A6DE7C8